MRAGSRAPSPEEWHLCHSDRGLGGMAGASPWDTMSLLQAADGQGFVTRLLGLTAAAIVLTLACTLYGLA